jgi:folylpolyglutamate synthase
VHVAGTKGKGSTCAFVRSFLRSHGVRTGFPGKIGLYTSPDLRHVRERIQIDNEPVDKDLFARYFWEVWDQLQPSVGEEQQQQPPQTPLPRYLQLLTLIAFHIFIRESVQVAIVETHHGGEFDTTNVVTQPVVTAITSIGMDHLAQLGPTWETVAWHKAGIFKPGARALSAPQDRPELIEVLRARAAERRVELHVVDDVHPALSRPAIERLPTAQVPVQRVNCSLALAVADAFLLAKGHPALTDDDILHGVEAFTWPGRFEIIPDGPNATWFLDGAHNDLSVVQAARWFAQNTEDSPRRPRILIFSHFSENREGKVLADRLARSLQEHGARPQHVIFTTYQERADGSSRFGEFWLSAPSFVFSAFFSLFLFRPGADELPR